MIILEDHVPSALTIMSAPTSGSSAAAHPAVGSYHHASGLLQSDTLGLLSLGTYVTIPGSTACMLKRALGPLAQYVDYQVIPKTATNPCGCRLNALHLTLVIAAVWMVVRILVYNLVRPMIKMRLSNGLLIEKMNK